MAATAKQKGMESLIDQFCVITGSTPEDGARMLEACNGNLELAIGMHMEGGSRAQAPTSRGTTDAATAGPSSATAAEAIAESIRAPIPQREETLVEETPVYGFRGRRRNARSVFDGFRDFQAETRQQESMRVSTRVSNKRKTLEDLFRPPIDIIHKGTFKTARDVGTSQNRWLMVNVQNVQEFACQALNRDVWSNASVKTIINQHFIFWQVYHDSEEGRKYMQFYKIEQWPYVAILDPRTGENLVVWNKLDSMTFCDLVTEFVAQQPSLDGSFSSSPPAKKVKREDSIVDASEDAQMKAAIQASLTENSSSSSSASFKPKTITLDDSDTSAESDVDLETFTDSDSENSNLSPVKKGRNSKQKSVPPMCTRGNSSNAIKQPHSKGTAAGSSANNTRCNSRRDSMKSAASAAAAAKANLIDIAASSGEDSEVEKESHNDMSITDNGEEKWKKYLGQEEDTKTMLMLRYPDGSREQLSIPPTSKLWAVVYFVIGKGYSNEQYELITHFPRRRISDLDFDSTLKQSGLHPQETVFVQAR